MSKQYSEDEFLNLIKSREKWNGKELYQQSFINYKGKTSDSQKRYTEILSEKLYNDKLKIDAKEIDESKEKESHSPIHNREDVKFTNYKPGDIKRNEENIAKRMFQLGSSVKKDNEYSVVDYQIPVNRVQHTSDGKIDLILTTCSNVIIGELKGEKSTESLIRAVLEVETYFRKVSHEKLKKCYNKKNVAKAILLFKGTRPFEEFISSEYVWVKRLLNKWNISILEVESISSIDEVPPKSNHFNFIKIN